MLKKFFHLLLDFSYDKLKLEKFTEIMTSLFHKGKKQLSLMRILIRFADI